MHVLSPQDVAKIPAEGDFSLQRVVRVFFERDPSTGAVVKGGLELFVPHTVLIGLLIIIAIAVILHYLPQPFGNGVQRHVPNFRP